MNNATMPDKPAERKRNKRKAVYFSLRFCIVYTILLTTVIWRARPLAAVMFTIVGKVGARTLPRDIIMILHLDETKTEDDFNMVIGLTTREHAIQSGFCHGGKLSRADVTVVPQVSFFWTPVIFLASLVLAAPREGPLRASLCRLAFGLLCIYGFLLLRFVASLHGMLVTSNWLMPKPPGGVYAFIAGGTNALLNKTQWFSSIVAVIIWLGVYTRGGFLQHLFRQNGISRQAGKMPSHPIGRIRLGSRCSRHLATRNRTGGQP